VETPSRIAVVTGGGSGIGRAVALGLAAHGYTVVVSGRRAEALEETVRRAGANAASVLAVPGNVADPESVKALFDAVRERCGRLDLLFNNAGTASKPASVEDVTLEQWRSVLDANLTGAFLCTREAVRMMKTQTPRGGRIINNGSIAAHVPRPHSVAYTASKHGITGLTKATALDGRPFDIACGQIDIGNAATEMTERFATGTLQANLEIKSEPRVDVRHVVDAVIYMAGLPLDANVPCLTVMATKMPFGGRG
jgi:NAD(P)-dependent dehydrogenase (short-subunit alcohol dehydrogenase family)